MNSRSGGCHQYSVGEGPQIPVHGVSALRFNLANQRVAMERIGSKAWWDSALHEIRLLGQPELLDVIGTVDDPRNPRVFRLGHEKTKRPAQEKCPNPNWTRDSKARKHPKQRFCRKVEKAIAELEQCDPEFTSFVTAHLAVCLDYASVEKARQSAMKSFRQFLIRRFPDHKALFFVEYDIKLAKHVDAALLADNSWRINLTPNTLVYVIHTHGTLCTRHVRSCDIADAFRFTPNGKRSALYGGSRQVFAAPLDRIDEEGSTILDVRGVSGYATKAHFVPPVPTRMLEGLPEWLVVYDSIANNRGSILISGMRVRKPYGGARPTLKGLRSVMRKIRNRMTPQERWEDDLIDQADVELFVVEGSDSDGLQQNIIRDESDAYLNSDSANIWQNRVKLVQKKITGLFQPVRRFIISIVDIVRRRSAKQMNHRSLRPRSVSFVMKRCILA